MTHHPSSSRRAFLKSMAAVPIGAAALGDDVYELAPREQPKAPTGANDRVRIATIGMGIIGFEDTQTALKVPGVELAAVADVYEGRRIHAQEVFGKDVQAYVDYREILDRPDIDAVLVCTPDHWHKTMAVEALRAGKAVYCEKPMVRTVDEGPEMIRAQEETGNVLQIGSQYASSILYDKAQELVASGAIGKLNSIEARYNRNSAIGAWQYSIPLDASPETVDWDRFLGSAPRRPFDATRVFRWRNYWDYGTAVAGDLYVHLLTAIHHVTGALGPDKVAAMGGRRYWDDGRDVYDIIMGLFDYPETEEHPSFTVALQSNFEDGGGPQALFRFVGSDGVISLTFTDLTLTKVGIVEATAKQVLEGYNSVRTFSDAQQEAFAEAYLAENPPGSAANRSTPEVQKYVVPRGYSERLDHFVHFFDCVRTGKTPYEDAVFGLRAAGPALLANTSYRENRQVGWDPLKMRVTG